MHRDLASGLAVTGRCPGGDVQDTLGDFRVQLQGPGQPCRGPRAGEQQFLRGGRYLQLGRIPPTVIELLALGCTEAHRQCVFPGRDLGLGALGLGRALVNDQRLCRKRQSHQVVVVGFHHQQHLLHGTVFAKHQPAQRGGLRVGDPDVLRRIQRQPGGLGEPALRGDAVGQALQTGAGKHRKG